MDAPDSKVDAARDRFCPPYKPALWSQFLTEVLGRPVAARLLSDGDSSARSPASPVRAMRPFSPQPTSAPRGGRSGVGAHRVSKDRAPSSLEYVAVTSLGLIVLVMALAFAPGGLAAVEKKTRVFLRLFADAVGWRDETVQWLIKVLTVGGTLALSGAVVGAVIMGLVSIIVYAVFASR
jgi:type III secretory pathway component EscS